MIKLNNGQVEASIHEKGAELQALRSISTGINYMWTGDPAYWGKFSPVLFPIVGQLHDNKYLYNGKEHSLPRHGFARDRVFKAEQISDTAAVFTLTDDAESHAVYPFAFRLQVFYTLKSNQLIVRYLVNNTGKNDLLFSLGAHPAFVVPLQVNGVQSAYEDYSLEFNRSTVLQRWKLTDGLLTNASTTIALENHSLPLNTALFKEDAMVMKGMPDNSIRLGCSKHQHGILFSWQNFPFFGIWAAPGAPFVCLEPWSGIADHVDHDYQLTSKEGIQSLLPGADWSASWQVDCF
jgi:galactose mutarotase-like enzyme